MHFSLLAIHCLKKKKQAKFPLSWNLNSNLVLRDGEGWVGNKQVN